MNRKTYVSLVRRLSFKNLMMGFGVPLWLISGKESLSVTRPDTRLPKSRAGGQGPYLRLTDHVGRSSEVKEIKS